METLNPAHSICDSAHGFWTLLMSIVSLKTCLSYHGIVRRPMLAHYCLYYTHNCYLNCAPASSIFMRCYVYLFGGTYNSTPTPTLHFQLMIVMWPSNFAWPHMSSDLVRSKREYCQNCSLIIVSC